eukprot:CAMPEP_0194125528 /NCGR_PEP_ID=MMETSP0150-20130528/59510_1 /TAXON_ID=122233 /ORGANISM="Chaetoceros debilis, Strain MM31A-1" /LENGTH=693 /DNA_ID=CAMNT_0038819339 /DNA_START=83 /DNA_END=2167 /DNA_ORIENTATION=-
MKLCLYKGLAGEKVPDDVTHVIVDESVTVIKERAFYKCEHLVSVIMDEDVKRIEGWAFYHCYALRFVRLSKTLEYIGLGAFCRCESLEALFLLLCPSFIRLSKTLEYIGLGAFCRCESLEALFLPSTVKDIGDHAFYDCRSLRLMILPNDINLDYVGNGIVHRTAINQIAETVGVAYAIIECEGVTDESNHHINEWLYHHMDEWPFHKLCCDPSATTKHINDYIHEHGNDAAYAIDTTHSMTPLHVLSMNPHAPSDAIATLEYIGLGAFHCCESLEALFLPSTVTSIECEAFRVCRSLRLIILPNDIDLDNADQIIPYTVIYQFAENAGVAYEEGDEGDDYGATGESNRRVNEWLIRHMDHAQFHKLCYNSSITTKHINDYLNEQEIKRGAFGWNQSLRLLILPNDIDLDNVRVIIDETAISQIAENAGVAYERTECCDDGGTEESSRRVNEWLIQHMDNSPFHKLCYNSSITTKHINDYLNEHGNDSARAIDTIHGMTPLHMLSMNPHSPADAIAALLDVDMEVVFRLDNQGKISLDYARDYNVGGLNLRVNEWLVQHMDEEPFHKICYNSSISTRQLNDYLKQLNDYHQGYGNDAALAIDPYHGMTPLHMLSMNPYAPADTIAALLEVNVETTAFSLDNEGKIPLDYARDYNVGGLVAMIVLFAITETRRAALKWIDSHQFISWFIEEKKN